jgi:TonB-dependent SusC/RagA subfamily outer membrane receptor
MMKLPGPGDIYPKEISCKSSKQHIMKTILPLIFISISIILFSCSTSRDANQDQINLEPTSSIQDPDPSVTLEQHLQKVPGVMVHGSGQNARIRIRGISSLNSGNDPLFVVNGQSMSGGFAAVRNSIAVGEIKSIKVLKNPSEVGFYGVRGANGVIEITLRKHN